MNIDLYTLISGAIFWNVSSKMDASWNNLSNKYRSTCTELIGDVSWNIPRVDGFMNSLFEMTIDQDICDCSLEVHRYTRWTGRLSHQTSNLSCPCNPLPEGCDLCLAWYQVQGGVGSDLPSYHQTTEVTLTEGSQERSGYMHMNKQVTHSILGMLFSMRGTKTAKVEGLWLVNRPEHLVPEDPDVSPKVWLCSPFIVPSLYSTRNPCDIISWCHDHLLWSSSGKTTVHVHQNCCCSSAHLLASTLEPQILQMHLNLFVSSLTQFLHLWYSPPGISVCPHIGVLIYLHILNKTQASIINKQGWWM